MISDMHAICYAHVYIIDIWGKAIMELQREVIASDINVERLFSYLWRQGIFALDFSRSEGLEHLEVALPEAQDVYMYMCIST